jgi:hypothetical protein
LQAAFLFFGIVAAQAMFIEDRLDLGIGFRRRLRGDGEKKSYEEKKSHKHVGQECPTHRQ